jgi:SOS response regulatory protein OraA/RecX
MNENQDQASARSLALYRISVREYGAAEMRRYLVQKGISESDAAQVVRELVEEQAINDERYARVIARHQAHRHKGPAYVEMRLRQKGVQLSRAKLAEIFAEVLPDSAATELELIRQVIETRYQATWAQAAAGDTRARAKLYSRLTARGFSRETVMKALREPNGETI